MASLGAGAFAEANAFASDMQAELKVAIQAYLYVGAQQAGVSQTTLSLDGLPAGARVPRQTVELTAAPARFPAIRDVAEVRPVTGDPGLVASQLVIDFQTLRTVSMVAWNQGSDDPAPPTGIARLFVWLGTAFADEPIFEIADGASAAATATFQEVQSERLLVVVDSPIAAAGFAASFIVGLPAPPSDLELKVGGQTAWRHPEAVRRDTGGWSEDYKLEVDITGAVQAALDAGAQPVQVTLGAGIPGALGIAVKDSDFLEVHPVSFPEGGTRVVGGREEGLYELGLPLPEDAANWELDSILSIVDAEVAPQRVFPAAGPPASGEVQLTLDNERSAAVRLPEDWLNLFERLEAVRLALRPGPDGAEVAGLLYQDGGAAPGKVLPDISLGPVTLDPGSAEQPAGFVTLALSQALELGGGQAFWLSIEVTRGSVEWPLELPEPGEAPQARLVVGAPGGPFGALPQLATLSAEGLGGVVRIAGRTPESAPIPALRLRAAEGEQVGTVTPDAEGTAAGLPLAGVTLPTDRTLRIEAISHVPAEFAFRSVEVLYRRPSA